MIAHQESAGEFSQSGIPQGQTVLEHFGPETTSDRFAVYERRRPNGKVLEVRSTRTYDGGFVRTFADVTERREAQEHVVELASQDALTGLANRRAFRAALDAAVTDVQQGDSAGSGFSILCLDLDRFKTVNDTLGHPVGDLLLQAVAKRLRDAIRRDDVLARIGGDEFAIILRNAPNADVAETVSKRIIKAISKRLRHQRASDPDRCQHWDSCVPEGRERCRHCPRGGRSLTLCR